MNKSKIVIPPIPDDFMPNFVNEPKFRAGQWEFKVKHAAADAKRDAKRAREDAKVKAADEKAAVKGPRYFASHEGGLNNGSFFRVWPKKRFNEVAQFVNGDYMGTVKAPKTENPGFRFDLSALPEDSYFGIGAPEIVDGIPLTYSGNPLKEYPKSHAEYFTPTCCGGKGNRTSYIGKFPLIEPSPAALAAAKRQAQATEGGAK